MILSNASNSLADLGDELLLLIFLARFPILWLMSDYEETLLDCSSLSVISLGISDFSRTGLKVECCYFIELSGKSIEDLKRLGPSSVSF